MNYKFPNFFLPTSDSRWQGSSFELTYSFRDGQNLSGELRQSYGKAGDRWTPRYENRPERHVEYIGIRSCVPRIEDERSTTYLEFSTTVADGDVMAAVRVAASRVLNRNYAELSTKQHWTGKRYRGVAVNQLAYSSLSMGAGEQRVFEILERLYFAPKYSLILIDELDLLMHEDALRRLVDVIHARAEDRGLQVVFTTHRESILSRGDKVLVHHVFSAGGKTFSMPGTHPDVLHRLTGSLTRSIEVFVEDDVSSAVVARQAEMLDMRRHVSITPVGAASNIVTLACAFALRNGLNENQGFFMDGDVYRSSDERTELIAKALTGSSIHDAARRERALAFLRSFALQQGEWPEKVLHEMLVQLPDSEPECAELKALAAQLNVPAERHGFVGQLVEAMGHSRDVGVAKIVEAASRSPGWGEFVGPLAAWLSERKSALAL
ncbi:AAA family ATPase [Pseudoxanthomonas sp. F11]|uniref:AAA family ATPase n=1 Tax=Pseudoxanthomonas sp. F11 TaxID=3126308 RepID=UPI00300CAC65